MVILVVELKVFELNILSAALAEFRPRLAVVDVALELLGNHLQLTVLALHEASRALLLLRGEKGTMYIFKKGGRGALSSFRRGRRWPIVMSPTKE